MKIITIVVIALSLYAVMIVTAATMAFATEAPTPKGPTNAATSSATNTSNTTNRNANRQNQSQKQGQSQSASSTAKARSRSSADATATGGQSTSHSAGGDATATGGNSSSTGGSAMGGSSNNAIVYPRTAAAAYAPTFNPTVNCASVVGFGAQGAPFGLSVGGSHQNAECERQELAKTVMAFGDRATAEEILCDSDSYRQARRRTNRPCAEVVVTQAEAGVYNGTDNLVRYRHGLPLARE